MVEVPDLEIHEPYIEILDRESGMRVVTVMELVSPLNKYAGTGRERYIAKQQEILCEPPLSAEDQAWADETIRAAEAGL